MSKINSINPANAQINASFDTISNKDALLCAKRAHDAYEKWSALKLEERALKINALSNVLIANKQKYAQLMTLEMGKPIGQSIAEIEKCAATARLFSKNASQWLKDENVLSQDAEKYITFSPIGTILAIMPWNFPFWQAMRMAIPSLVLGNSVILRHSNTVPMCSLAIQSAFEQAGISNGVFTSIICDHNAIRPLLKSDNIQGVSLTGSEKAGSEVAKIAGRYIKKAVLELGGSDPFIVLEDAQVEFACQKAKDARNLSSGQSCIAAKRFIVSKGVYDDFVGRLKDLTERTIVGDPMNMSTEIGPLANKEQLAKISMQVEDAKNKGAKIECGAERIEGEGYYYKPTLITGVKKNMLVLKEEVFGPISPVVMAKDDDDAIRIANSSRLGLGASIWTEDRQKGKMLARKLDAGIVYVNGIVRSDPSLPFGGVKASGIGRELSRYGMLEFANIKPIVVS